MRYYKIYEDREYAGQTGSFHTLVYDSTYISPTNVQGNWFYLGHEHESVYNGTWAITYSGDTWNNYNPNPNPNNFYGGNNNPYGGNNNNANHYNGGNNPYGQTVNYNDNPNGNYNYNNVYQPGNNNYPTF